MPRDRCLLCNRKLIRYDDKIQIHPKTDGDCEVVFTDSWGVAIELDVDNWPVEKPDAPYEPVEGEIIIDLFPHVDECLTKIFASYGVPRLGGASSGKGWTGFGLFQRCPVAWRKRYLDPFQPREGLILRSESPAIAIGAIIHTHLALYYSALRPESPYAKIKPIDVHNQLLSMANPTFVNEGWRVFTAYTLYYKHDEIVPLAIEHDTKDPRTGESCRYDMIAFHPNETLSRPAGTYIYEFKSHAIFSADNLECYAGDGEILGQIALWKKLSLDKRFGELKGVVVDILGKQKVPKFHRTWVPPNVFLIDQHLDDLRRWDGLIQLAKATNNFPHARNNCVGRWGRCEHFDDCAMRDTHDSAYAQLVDATNR